MSLPVQNVLKLRWAMLASREHKAARGIEKLGQAHVNFAEIPGEYLIDAGDVEISQLLNLSRSKQVHIWSVRLPFRQADDIAEPDDELRRLTVSRYRELIRKTAVVGGSVAILTPSHQKSIDVDPDDIVSAICRSLDELLPIAEKFNIKLALKNLLPPYFGCRPEHFEMVMSLYESRHLGCCFDTGHGHLNKCFEDMLEIMWPRMLAVHLHDNMADRDWHLQPGYGNAPLGLLFAKMLEHGWSEPCVVECRQWGPLNTKRLFLEMDALVNALVGGADDFPTLFAPSEMFSTTWPTDWRHRTPVRCPDTGHLVVFWRDRASSPALEWPLTGPLTRAVPMDESGF